MTVRNDGLGGSDFNTPSDRVKPTDLNDTLDVIADAINKSLGSLFNDIAQNIFNAAYIGFDSKLNGDGSPNLDKVDYDIFDTDSMTGGFYDSTNEKYLFITSIDECETGSIAASWTTTGTTSETANYIQTTNVGSLTSDGTSPHDFYDATDVVQIRFRMEEQLNAGGGGSSGTARWGLTDGVATVWLETNSVVAGGASYNDDSVWDVYVDEANQKAHTYNDGVLANADIDISSLTGSNFYVVMDITVIIITGHQRMHYLYANFEGDVIDITSSGLATGETVNNAVIISNSDSGTDCSLAADGSTFESVVNKEVHRFSATGTTLKSRASQTISSISIPTTLLEFTEYATKYNILAS